MSGLMLKLVLGFSLFAAVAASATGAWYYVQNLKAENKVLEQQVAAKQFEADQSRLAFETLQRDNEILREVVAERDANLAGIRDELDYANRQLERHDRNYLARSKPGLVASIAKREIENQARCDDIQINGAELTESELNASRPSEINKFCWRDANPRFDPDLWPEWRDRNL